MFDEGLTKYECLPQRTQRTRRKSKTNNKTLCVLRVLCGEKPIFRNLFSISGKKSVVLAALLTPLGTLHAAPDAQAILAASDAVRNPGKPFALTTTLVEYRDGKQTDTHTLTVYSKANENSGQFRSLIRFVAPARDTNKLMLKSGNDLWFYDPSSKASI